MSQPTPIVMLGAGGRMGRMILELAAADPERYAIRGAVEHAGHPDIDMRLDQLIPGGPADVKLTAEPPAKLDAGAVAIHFTLPEAIEPLLEWNVAAGCGAVIGTTGLSEAQHALIRRASEKIAILPTPNTSSGVNVLFWLVEQANRLLGADYDVEIVEMHHHHKKDAPSGTAMRLAEGVLGGRGGNESDLRHGREGQVGARTAREVGMHALRGGDVVGEHTVVFAGPGERIELTHRAHSRATFAQGALRAAAWLSGRGPGLYSMKDVLGMLNDA